MEGVSVRKKESMSKPPPEVTEGAAAIFGLELVCSNPMLAAEFKEGLVLRRPKDDSREALEIASRLRFGEPLVSCVPSDLWQGLRRLTPYRLSRALSEDKNRF